jgi:hypothetical protein
MAIRIKIRILLRSQQRSYYVIDTVYFGTYVPQFLGNILPLSCKDRQAKILKMEALDSIRKCSAKNRVSVALFSAGFLSTCKITYR